MSVGPVLFVRRMASSVQREVEVTCLKLGLLQTDSLPSAPPLDATFMAIYWAHQDPATLGLTCMYTNIACQSSCRVFASRDYAGKDQDAECQYYTCQEMSLYQATSCWITAMHLLMHSKRLCYCLIVCCKSIFDFWGVSHMTFVKWDNVHSRCSCIWGYYLDIPPRN